MAHHGAWVQNARRAAGEGSNRLGDDKCNECRDALRGAAAQQGGKCLTWLARGR